MTEAEPVFASVDAYLSWAESHPGRYELEGGRILAMSPENIGHVRVKAATHAALSAAIRRAGLPCEAVMDGVTVRIDATSAYEPDALVYCGPPLPADAIVVPDPVIVVEVVSPSSGRRDHHEKLIGYFGLPGVRHYLILDSLRRTLIHHTRDGEAIATRILRSGELRLDPPGLVVAIEDLFGPA